MMWLVWGGFVLFVIGCLALDLGVLNRKDHVIEFRESLRWTGLWVAVALAFSGVIYSLYEHHVAALGYSHTPALRADGASAVLQFLSGYVVEYSLSVDNIFVIALIIGHFKVPRPLQHGVLFWGILGALVLRGMMIGLGAALIHQFSWMMEVFGALLVFTAMRMAVSKENEGADLEQGLVVRTARRFIPVSMTFAGHKFFVRHAGRRTATPLLLVLLLVETTDILFAVDSIPAVFAVTQDPFLVFTSNVFAIMGLRSLYFAVAGLIDQFHYLKFSLVVLLATIGVKMLIARWIHVANWQSLLAIVAILGAGVVASVLRKRRLDRATV